MGSSPASFLGPRSGLPGGEGREAARAKMAEDLGPCDDPADEAAGGELALQAAGGACGPERSGC
jgi:hypothetical protein